MVLTEPAKLPDHASMNAGLHGERVTLVPLDAEAHAAALYEAVKGHPELWLYLFDDEPADEAVFKANLARKAGKSDPFFLTILDNATGLPLGMASYMRIEPRHRVIEVGSILFSPKLQRTAQATETMYLMARHAFEDLGYRRYEWKCNALNEPSRRAALRLGFSFEGIFRQHMIVKGKSRDTAWFAMLDEEWPVISRALRAWLSPVNFDDQGRQVRSLADIRSSLE
jgi:RimJ/RimL family protein N-acetyltransferase